MDDYRPRDDRAPDVLQPAGPAVGPLEAPLDGSVSARRSLLSFLDGLFDRGGDDPTDRLRSPDDEALPV